jgi:hypothetical protein
MINVNLTVNAKELPGVLEILKKEGIPLNATINAPEVLPVQQETSAVNPVPSIQTISNNQPAEMTAFAVQPFPVQPVQPVNIQPVTPIPAQVGQPIQMTAPVQVTGVPVNTGALPGTIPTTAKTYTLDELTLAAGQLCDAGRRQDIINLMAQFGVQMMTGLRPDQYGAFALKLREMGARI